MHAFFIIKSWIGLRILGCKYCWPPQRNKPWNLIFPDTECHLNLYWSISINWVLCYCRFWKLYAFLYGWLNNSLLKHCWSRLDNNIMACQTVHVALGSHMNSCSTQTTIAPAHCSHFSIKKIEELKCIRADGLALQRFVTTKDKAF